MGGEAVKGTMMHAHLAWARERLDAAGWERPRVSLEPEHRVYLERATLATDWVPFDALVRIDVAVPIRCHEPHCQSRGQPYCRFDLSW